MTTMAPVAVHDVLEDAADAIDRNGYCRHYLYSTAQAEAGLPLDRCAVDILGAINLVTHGSPLYAIGDQLAKVAEAAIAARINAPSVAAWSCYPRHGKKQAIQLLRSVAAELRAEADQ